MHHRLLVRVLLLTLPVSALTVTTAADELDSPAGANVSLREAIRDTPSLGTVDFNSSLNGGTLTLTLGELSVISKTLTIDASSLSVGITLDGGGNPRILTVGSGTVNILGVRFTCGFAPADGGAIYAFSSSHLTLTSCTVTSNTSALGGGGLWLISPATRTITNTIVARNTSVDDADLSLQGATLTRAGANFIRSNDGNSSVFPAGNPNPNGDLVGTDAAPLNPRLSPLAFYGGTTESLHPLIGSPVINSGGATALATDQRGLTRTVGAATDIGSVETATPLTVTTALDENNGGLGLGTGDSLRECLSAVGTAGHISFAPGLNGQFIVLATGMMTVNGDKVFLDASSLASGVTVSGNSASRIFRLINNSTLALHSVHLNGGLHSGVAIG